MYQDHSAPIPGAEDPADPHELSLEEERRRRASRIADGQRLDVPEESVLRGGDRIHYDPREYARAAAERLAKRPLLHEMLRAAENTPSPIRYADPVRQADQEHVEGVIRDWADRAEDYLAQEAPPLPRALVFSDWADRLPPEGETREERNLRLAGVRIAEARVALRIVTDWDDVQKCRTGTVGLDPWGDTVTKYGEEDWRDQGDTVDDAYSGPYLPFVVLYEPEGRHDDRPASPENDHPDRPEPGPVRVDQREGSHPHDPHPSRPDLSRMPDREALEL